jgi:predicted transposase YdaD
VIVEIQKWYEELKQEIRHEGELEGRLATHASLLARRLGRPLSDAEHAVLAERLDRLGEDRIFDLVLTHDGEALATWLADPASN